MFSMLLALAMCLTMLPMGATPVRAEDDEEDWYERLKSVTGVTNAHGSDYTTGELANRLETIIWSGISGCVTPSLPKVGGKMNNSQVYTITYKNQSGSWSGYQCAAYAVAAYSFMFGYHCGADSYRVEFTGAKAKNSLSYSQFSGWGVKCGAYIRTTNSSSGAFNGGAGHSMIVLAYDSSYITMLEGNYDGNGSIGIRKYTWSEFNQYQLSGRSRYVCSLSQPKQSTYDELTKPTYASIPTITNVSVDGSAVSVSWTNSDYETGYDCYLIQAPWGWDDVKYQQYTDANVTSCTFYSVTDGEYCAFVIARPSNGNQQQSNWAAFTVDTRRTTVTLNPMCEKCGVLFVVVRAYGEAWNFPTPTNSGYTFDGWYSQKYGQGTKYLNDQTCQCTEDAITLYASWKKNAGFEVIGRPNCGMMTVLNQQKLDGVNESRGESMLILYNGDGRTVDTNIYGYEVAVDADGRITGKRNYGDTSQLTVPNGGFVLSGHSSGGESGGEFVYNAIASGCTHIFVDYETGIVYACKDRVAEKLTGSFSGNNLVATVSAPAGSRLIVSVYDTNGRMTGTLTRSIDDACTDKQYTFAFSQLRNGYTYKLLIVDAKTYIPLCKSWSCTYVAM